jgi:superfamily II DNA or RNA helicase
LRVDAAKEFRLIFTLSPDTEIGPLIEPYVVQLNTNETFSLTYQRVYFNTMDSFAAGFSDDDKEIIKISSEYALENIVKKFSKKDMRPHEFVSRFLDEKMLKDVIRPFVDDKLAKCIRLLKGRTLYFRGKSGNPAHRELEFEDEEVSVFFHFAKELEGTRYYPTFKCRNENISFVNKEVLLITNKPCILLCDSRLYYFEHALEGKKLTPFFSKWNIDIPKSSEPQYFKRFIMPLIEKHKVVARGFDIISLEQDPISILKMETSWNGHPQLLLYFDYIKEKIASEDPKKVHVKMEKSDDNYTYFKIIRQVKTEKKQKEWLHAIGLVHTEGSGWSPEGFNGQTSASDLVAWINSNRHVLEEHGFHVSQEGVVGGYFLEHIELKFDIKESSDWFDVYATVLFGTYQIPFIRLKKYILNEISEFELPDGRIAIIPKEWFAKYKDLLALSGGDENKLVVKKHHYALIDDILLHDSSKPFIHKNLYLNFNELIAANKETVPETFIKILRPYQEDGFHWMNFLKKNKFGGVLADDMGLGKTIQALALLLNEQQQPTEVLDAFEELEMQGGQLSLFDAPPKRNGTLKKSPPTLILMPTSLIHNWQYEVTKWAPALRVVVYTGLDRQEKLKQFDKADIILSTYGTTRNDIDLLKNYEFNYIILDESQVIKNPMAKISKAVKTLHAHHRLGLSGTPVENSLMDLWSQMSFLNPGLLGSYQYFRDEFVLPIEKKNDDERKQKLKILIQPFILRRTKEQVAKDLPELSEKLYFSEMAPEQKDLYNETRNFYRKRILENMEEYGEQRARFFVLKGLMQLRQIANHPKMQDPNYAGESGKFDDIINTLDSVLSENHRVLIFSQFVRHLDLIKTHLKKENIPFAYLTGQTRKRAEEINSFKEDKDKPVFLISLKAGGVGLNLTEADYVFICDPWWNPAVEQQAINRAHRIGQDKSVFSYKFISKNTVEEKILILQDRKLKLSADLIQSHNSAPNALTKEDIDLLFS